MSELHVTALSEDGRHLLLAGEQDGKPVEFRLELDDRLRAALRGDLGRVGQQSIRLESQLRPREIQARVRAGEPLDVVARTAGVPVDRIEPYAVPVLTERAAMAGRARQAPLAVHGGEWAGVPADEIVAAHLIAEHGEPGAAAWDAWRREDGSWLVSVTWPLGGGEQTRSALFLWEPAGRRLTPADAGADALVGTRPAPRRDRPVGPTADPTTEPTADPASTEPTVEETSTEPTVEETSTEPTVEETSTEPTVEETSTGAVAAPTTATSVRQPDQPARRPGRRRASVPAWDDIMLGAATPGEPEPDEAAPGRTPSGPAGSAGT